MSIIILLAVGLLIGICWVKVDEWTTMGLVLALACGIFLLVALIAGPMNYYSTLSEINQYHATKATIDSARGRDVDSIEQAALIQKIIETNKWLADAQYWNKTMFDVFIPDEVMRLKPLK